MNPWNMASVGDFSLSHTHIQVWEPPGEVWGLALELTIDPEIIKQISESGVEGAAIVSVKSNNWTPKQ